jgi:hypothetical protein
MVDAKRTCCSRLLVVVGGSKDGERGKSAPGIDIDGLRFSARGRGRGEDERRLVSLSANGYQRSKPEYSNSVPPCSRLSSFGRSIELHGASDLEDRVRGCSKASSSSSSASSSSENTSGSYHKYLHARPTD